MGTTPAIQTELLLVVAPLKSEHGVHGLVEIFQRPGGGPTTQRGYLRFLVQMCDLASDYLKSHKLRHFRYRESLWEQLEQFICMIHASLDVHETAFTVANEGRRIIGVDRLSVAIQRAGRCQIEAVSGLDSLDRRAVEVQRMGELASSVVLGNEPLWYPRDEDELPPQIESCLQSYLDQSHSTMVAVLPLVAAATDGEPPEPTGALIVEQLRDSRSSEQLERRSETVAGYATNAISNAMEHNSLFLMPVWKAIGSAAWMVRARTLPKTISVAIGALLILLALAVVPASFDLSAKGKLQPSDRQQIFAPYDGVVDSISVDDGDRVHPQDELLRIKSNSLDAEITSINSKVATLQEQISAKNYRLSLNTQTLHPDERSRLETDILQLQQSLDSEKHQLALLEEQQRQLTLRSDIDAQVVTWKVVEKLRRRPVRQGQNLLTLANPDGDWELELYMPLRRMGHVRSADRDVEEELQVTFILSTHPGQQFRGRVIEMDQLAEPHQEEGPAVRIRVAVDKDELPELLDGTTVTAKVHCGHRSIGYVWFHEVIETVQGKVLFWL